MVRRYASGRRHRGGVSALVVVAALVLGACAAADVPEAPPGDAELSLGRDVWANNCVNCHGAAGGGGTGNKLSGGVVVDRYPDPAEQVSVVAEGVRAMPAFGSKLDDDELAAVVRYTREVIADQP